MLVKRQEKKTLLRNGVRREAGILAPYGVFSLPFSFWAFSIFTMQQWASISKYRSIAYWNDNQVCPIIANSTIKIFQKYVCKDC